MKFSYTFNHRIDCLAKILKLQYLSLAFFASSFSVIVDNSLMETDLPGPSSFFREVSLFVKELTFIFLSIDLIKVVASFTRTLL